MLLRRSIFSTFSVVFSIPLLAVLFIHSTFVDSAFAQSSAFTYEGRLFDTLGLPVLDSVSVKFQILNPAGTCVLYEEVQDAVNLVPSKGAFSLGVGSAISDTKRSVNFRGAYNPSMVSIFRNGTTLSSIPVAGCPTGTYTAGASDTRLLRVHVTRGSTTETLSPDLVINTAPYAQVAQSLQGFLPSDFLRLDAANGISGNIGLTATGTAAGQTREFRFYELAANGVEYSAFKAPDAMATTLTYVLPSSAPAAGDVLKATIPSSGVVTLSWGADAGAGGGISNFNGSNQSSQSFTAVDIAAVVTAPAWSTNAGTGAHTLQIPMASGAGVTGGLITKTEHTAFSAKVDRAGDTMTGLLNFTGATGLSLANTSGITFTGTGTIAMGTNKITGMGDPSAAQEAATKAYVDSQSTGKISGTLTATRIPYASGASTLADSANFTYTAATGAMTIGGTAPSITSNDAVTIAAGGTNKNVVLTPSGTGYTLLNGNVGVGTTSPLGILDVSGSSSSTNLGAFDANRSISIVNLDTTTNNAQGIALRSTGTNGTSIQSGVKLLGVNTARTASTITTDFAVLTNNAGTITEKMRVLANGNVGIGLTNPGYALDVMGTIHSTTNFIVDAGGGKGIRFGTASSVGFGTGGTWLSLVPDSSGIYLSDAHNKAVTGLGLSRYAYNFLGTGTASLLSIGLDPSNNAVVGAASTLFLQTSSTNRMAIDSAGNVGIGTTSPLDTLSIGTAPVASATRAQVNLSNTALVGGSASGTYIGVNPAAFAGNFIDLQVAGVRRFSVSSTGVITGDGSGITGISGAISGLTAGRVPLSVSSTSIADSANLTFNSTSGAMGIGGATPAITSSGSLSISAGGTNQNLALTPSGTGAIYLNGPVGDGGSSYFLNGGDVKVRDSGMFIWSSTSNAPVGAKDTGLARNGAGVVEINNGTAGNYRDLQLRSINPTTGNVGIGTTAPGALLQLGTAGTSLGTMRLAGNTSGYVQIQPAAAAGSWTMTLPPNDGASGEVLQTDGNGVTTWVASTGGSSSGTAGHVQFSNGSSGFSSDSNQLFWDSTNNRLGIGTATPKSLLEVESTSGFTFGYSDSFGGTFNGMSGVGFNVTRVGTTSSWVTGTNMFNNGGAYIDVSTGGDLRIFTIPQVNGVPQNLSDAQMLATQKMAIMANGNVGIGTTAPLDLLSLGTAPIAAATRAQVNLSNTTLSSGSTNGTYIGANPAAFTGDFINFQVGGSSRFRVSGAGVVTGDGSGLTGVTPSFSGMTAGQVRFASSATALSGSANLFWDNTNSRLGIGTTAPASSIHVGMAPIASANSGLLSLGSGAFDGSTAGYFGSSSSSSSSGTVIAANTASGYTGDLLNMQIAGSSKMKVTSAGNLIVSGQVASGVGTISSGATVNFDSGSTQILEAVGGSAITLNGMIEGATYQLVVTDTNSRTYTFTNCTNPHFSPANGPTTALSHTLYSILNVRIGGTTHCYISWSTGYTP